jgi:hypothetical protein
MGLKGEQAWWVEYSLSTAVLAKTVDYEKDGNGIENPTHMAASCRP